ncbi:MAG: hypothetical protein HYU66_15520 [Armatimonadetes bacterium]|nr:hypothetical protein [Armatimonadota bacterium]
MQRSASRKRQPKRLTCELTEAEFQSALFCDCRIPPFRWFYLRFDGYCLRRMRDDPGRALVLWEASWRLADRHVREGRVDWRGEPAFIAWARWRVRQQWLAHWAHHALDRLVPDDEAEGGAPLGDFRWTDHLLTIWWLITEGLPAYLGDLARRNAAPAWMDTARTFQATLDWAMRRAGATIGPAGGPPTGFDHQLVPEHGEFRNHWMGLLGLSRADRTQLDHFYGQERAFKRDFVRWIEDGDGPGPRIV